MGRDVGTGAPMVGVPAHRRHPCASERQKHLPVRVTARKLAFCRGNDVTRLATRSRPLRSLSYGGPYSSQTAETLPRHVLRADAGRASPDDGGAVGLSDAVASPDDRISPRLRIGPHQGAAPDDRASP